MFEEGHKLRGGPEIEFGKAGGLVDRAYLVEEQIVIRIWFDLTDCRPISTRDARSTPISRD
jgi:hypothetical protein